MGRRRLDAKFRNARTAITDWAWASLHDVMRRNLEGAAFLSVFVVVCARVGLSFFSSA